MSAEAVSLDGGWGHNGPCQPGCTCVMAKAAALKVPRVLPCLICGASLDPAVTGSSLPVATVFRAPGNYGSGVFDPLSRYVELAVNVCDGCLTEAGQQGRVNQATYRHAPEPDPEVRPWTAWEE